MLEFLPKLYQTILQPKPLTEYSTPCFKSQTKLNALRELSDNNVRVMQTLNPALLCQRGMIILNITVDNVDNSVNNLLHSKKVVEKKLLT
jgi:hypothetical protein